VEPSESLEALAARVDGATVTGDAGRIVTGICHDSRSVRPGDLFVCLRGAAHDGHRFAASAVGAGAGAIVADEGGLAAAGASLPPEVPVVTVPDTRAALPLLACALYGDPSQSLILVGVTGTNGKTTTTRLIAAILRAAGMRVGTIGTLGSELDGAPIESEHTTPEADQLQKLLARFRDCGADAVVMEVSSHALAQERTAGCAFRVAVFTNITQDHLDFHHTMEEYFETKARLFSDYPVIYPRRSGELLASVLNVDAWEGKDLVQRARGDILTFATGSTPANLKARDVDLHPSHTRFQLVCDRGAGESSAQIDLPIGGAFQVANALAAAGAAVALGIPLDAVARGLSAAPPVPGRFEAVPTGDSALSIIVDYAHTPDGLENLLRSARALNPARLLLVFGCGGDRDRTKRPKMGRLAATQAEFVVVTSDNPRTEQPDAIIAEIMAGIEAVDPAERAEIEVVPDRRRAIGLAIAQARPGDIVLIAGKGHEDYQIVGDRVLPFDDRLVAREIYNATNCPGRPTAGRVAQNPDESRSSEG
jgi:UDP-N-acetylmuramyl-tripeptide synthetase